MILKKGEFFSKKIPDEMRDFDAYNRKKESSKKLKKVVDKTGEFVYNNPCCQRESNDNGDP